MEYIKTLDELSRLPKDAILKYPNYADDFAEVIPAHLLYRLIKKYPDEFIEDQILRDYHNKDIELRSIIKDMDEFAEEFDYSISTMINTDKYFIPAIQINVDPFNYSERNDEDINIIDLQFEKLIESKGYKLFYVPYDHNINNIGEIRNWWIFD